MPVDVRVLCISKRDHHYSPHERIEGLGGITGGDRWYMPEDRIITELTKSPAARRWNFYVALNEGTARVIVATHLGRRYLKTEVDGYSPDNLLRLPECLGQDLR